MKAFKISPEAYNDAIDEMGSFTSEYLKIVLPNKCEVFVSLSVQGLDGFADDNIDDVVNAYWADCPATQPQGGQHGNQ